MKITYFLTRESVATGLSRSLAYRHPMRRLLMPLFGAILIPVSLYYLLANENEGWLIGLVLLMISAFYILLPIFRTRRVVDNVFAGKTGDLKVVFSPTDDSVHMVTPSSSGTATWQNFVDFKICNDGLLLYPQKSLHFWIPDSAEIEDGTWQDFTALISSKISRKI